MFAISMPAVGALPEVPGGQPVLFLVLLVAFTVLSQILLMLVLRIARLLVGHTETTLDDKILAKVSRFLPPLSLLIALFAALQLTYPDLTLGGFSESGIFVILLVGVLSFMAMDVLDVALVWYGSEIQPRKRKVNERDIFPFVRNILKVIIFAMFVVFVLQRAGFDTTALITGLGIGGLAVALALQDTLSNFFAGIHLLVDKPFREDDYIRTTDGSLEGTVEKIGWRTTKVATATRNEVFVPNSKLANSIVENFSSPRDNSMVSLDVGVDYKEDVDHVERVITEALKAVEKRNSVMVPGSQWVRFSSFGDYSLNFKFGYEVVGYANRFQVLKDVQRELFYSFRKEGINVPFPVRVVYNVPAAEPEKTERKRK